MKVDLSLNNKEFYKKYSRKKIASIYTLGCKVNQYESEAISGIFKKKGYEIVDFEEFADVYVINTCTVTSLSDRKSRQMIRRAKKNNPSSVVAVVGCYSQTASREVEKIADVDIIMGTKDRQKVPDFVEEFIKSGEKINTVGNIMKTKEFEPLCLESYTGRTRAFIKIQEGCSQFCSYCIIPYARGPIRSRNPEDVINEVKKVAEAGFKEVVLTGIHIASYGKDIKNTSLLDIIVSIHEIMGIERISIGSIEPTTITEEFARTIGNLPKVCPHFHVSLQSGCDETLKRMNRKYDSEQYYNGVQLLRKYVQDVAITTDVMVGFPGETDEEFEKSYKFLEKVNFAQMHVFKYSPRKGTPAASYTNQVLPDVKEARSKQVIILSHKLRKKFLGNFTGRNMAVLFEQEVKDRTGYMEGHTNNFIRVMAEGDINLKGTIKNVRLENCENDYFLGKLI